MKSFLNEYGFAILSTIIVILIIMMISPVGVSIRNGLFDFVLRFTDTTSAGMEQLDNTLSSLNEESAVDTGHYITFSSDEGPFTVSLRGTSLWNGGNIEYSKDKKEWTAFDQNTIYTASVESNGEPIYMRGWDNSNLEFRFDLTGSAVKCKGNLENLVDYKIVEDGGHPSIAKMAFNNAFAYETELVEAPDMLFDNFPESSFAYMYSGCTSLVKGPSLIKADNSGYQAFASMFENCTSLTRIPSIQIKNVGRNSFDSMFRNCTSITSIPDDKYIFETVASEGVRGMFMYCTNLVDIPSEVRVNGTMGDYAFYMMFLECKSITETPLLSSTVLGDRAYDNMFYNCTSLVDAKPLNAEVVPEYAYAYMFMKCTSLVSAPAIAGKSFGEGACYEMFAYDSSLKNIPAINDFHNIDVTGLPFNYMFQDCPLLNFSKTYTQGTNIVFYAIHVNGTENTYSYGTLMGTDTPPDPHIYYNTNYFLAPGTCIVTSSNSCK